MNKTFILFGVMLATTFFAYFMHSIVLMWVGIIGIPVVSFIASRNVERASLWAPIFAVMLGLMAGTITYLYNTAFEGIVFNAVTLTFGIMFLMLTLYKTGVIKVTERFRRIIGVAVGAIMLLYVVSFVVYLFGGEMPFLHEASPIGGHRLTRCGD